MWPGHGRGGSDAEEKNSHLRELNWRHLDHCLCTGSGDCIFEIETSPHDRMIFLRMSGVFTLDCPRACAAAKEAAVERLGPPYDAHSTLLDIRDFRVQAQEVFAIFT